MNEKDQSDEELTGVVLAGGYSRRFGTADKALACVDGNPLLVRVVSRLHDLTETVVVSCRSDQREAFEAALVSIPVSVRFAEDSTTDCGPLFGFRMALEQIESEQCVLIACDTPFLDPRTLSDISGRLDDGIEAVAVRTSDGCVQPIPAVYRTAPTESVCDKLLESGEQRLSALFDRLASRTVPANEVAGNVTRCLFDVDTPEEHDQAVEMLSSNEVIFMP